LRKREKDQYHSVQCFESDHALNETVARFASQAILEHTGIVIIATSEHNLGIEAELLRAEIDVERLKASGKIKFLDARATLNSFLCDGQPDPGLFQEQIGAIAREFTERFGKFYAYGEMVGLLLKDGNHKGVVSLERLWNDLSEVYSFNLLCGYPSEVLGVTENRRIFSEICTEHSHVFPSSKFVDLKDADEKLRFVADLEQRALSLETELKRREQAEAQLNDFFENAILGLHIVGPDGTILRANRAELELLGYSEEEYVGHNISEFHADAPVINDILECLSSGKAIHGYPSRLKCKDGSIKHVLIYSNVNFADGNFINTRCITRDITEQVKAEEARKAAESELLKRKKENEFRQMVECVKDYAIFTLDPQGNIVTWNDGAKLINGYDASEIIGTHFSCLYTPEDQARHHPEEELEVAAREGKYGEEGWRVRKDGSRFWASVLITAVYNDQGKLIGFTKVTRDLTERKRSEEELQRARERFEKQAKMFDTALSASPDFYYTFDVHQRFTYVNKALLSLLGLTLEQAVGKNIEELGYPLELVKLYEAQLDEVLRTGKSVRGDHPYTGAEGKRGYFEYIFTPIFGADGSVQAISGTTRDVTLRKEAEESLKKSQGFLDSVIENIPHMVFVKDAKDLRFVRFNRAGEELIGYSRSDLIGKNDYDFFPKEQADQFIEKDREVLRGNSVVDISEEPIETKCKGRRLLRTRKIPIFGSNGTPEYLLGISEDITDWKRAEEARLQFIREQAAIEERKRENARASFLAEASTIFASSLEFRKTLDEVAHLVVPKLADWCTVTILREDSTKERVAAVHHEEEKKTLIDDLAKYYPASGDENSGIGQVIRTGESLFTPRVNDSELVQAARDERHLKLMRELACYSCIIVPIFARGKSMGAIAIVSGNPERLYNEADLALMEELGRRAGIAMDNAFLYEAAQAAIRARDEFLSIASHELKTPLTSLKLQAQMRSRDLKKGDLKRFTPEKLPQLVADDEKQVNRLIRLVDDMLDISRVQSGKLTFDPECFDLNELVSETLRRFSAQIDASQSKVTFRAGTPAVGNWDRFRIEQVFINLLTNALKYGAGNPIQIDISTEGDFALLRVQDQGIGIQQQDQERIFGQFERAISASSISGLGLGLYISRKIIEGHQGKILVQSEPGRGSVFTIELPLASTSTMGLVTQTSGSSTHNGQISFRQIESE
jgi:PAS domain S-box-containing protein